jgi:hypothetical protein
MKPVKGFVEWRDKGCLKTKGPLSVTSTARRKLFSCFPSLIRLVDSDMMLKRIYNTPGATGNAFQSCDMKVGMKHPHHPSSILSPPVPTLATALFFFLLHNANATT